MHLQQLHFSSIDYLVLFLTINLLFLLSLELHLTIVFSRSLVALAIPILSLTILTSCNLKLVLVFSWAMLLTSRAINALILSPRSGIPLAMSFLMKLLFLFLPQIHHPLPLLLSLMIGFPLFYFLVLAVTILF